MLVVVNLVYKFALTYLIYLQAVTGYAAHGISIDTVIIVEVVAMRHEKNQKTGCYPDFYWS